MSKNQYLLDESEIEGATKSQVLEIIAALQAAGWDVEYGDPGSRGPAPDGWDHNEAIDFHTALYEAVAGRRVPSPEEIF